MCELMGLSANKRIRINEELRTFYSHSVNHHNGWGLAILDADPVFACKEADRALDSPNLKKILACDITTSSCIAHIRRATIGEINVKNSHPFTGVDASGRRWILAHNGTIFDSDVLAPYQHMQEGTTDSERILLYIVDLAGRHYRADGPLFNANRRIRMVDEAIKAITPGNKVNLLIHDGEYLYVHKNQAGTLHMKRDEAGVLFSTQPLDDGAWEEFPQNQLMVYIDGRPVYAGEPHGNTYIHDEEKMKILYFAYSGL